MEYFPIALEKTKLYQAELAAQEEQYNAEQAAKKAAKKEARRAARSLEASEDGGAE